MRLLVDAANVVGSRPDGWWRDRPGAAARLVASLADLERLDGVPVEEVVVVLEGAARCGADAGARGRVRVVHAPGEGDDALAERCAEGVVLVTADRGLAERARRRGAEVAGPRRLLEALGGQSPAR